MSWTETTLGELISGTVGSIKTGPFGTALKASEYSTSGVPIISVGEVGYGALQLRRDTPFAPDEVTARLPDYVLKTGDIVFGRKGAVDRSAWVKSEEDGWFLGSDGIRLRLPSTIHSRFISYQLRAESAKTWLLQHAAGSTMLSLNQKILERVPLLIPKFHEQQAIAEVLGALDDKIAANTKLAATAEGLAVALLSQFQPSVALDEIVNYHKNSTNPEMLDDSPVAQYSLPAFDTGQLPEESSPLDIKSSKFLIERPAVLVSKLNPRFPRIWDVSEVPSIPALASTEFLVLEPMCSSTTVLWAILSQPDFSAALESKVAGTSGSHQRVKPTDLLATLVPHPSEISPDIQHRVTSIGLRAAQTRMENQRLATTRDALLPQLMSGKLRVKDAEALVSAAV